MNSDDIRKLIGGYATGSLTEAERTALFEAALDDQDLFDELAREQALKETLDQPGAKQRLIAALDGGRPAVSRWRPLVWISVSLAGFAVGLTAWVMLRKPEPVQIAVVRVAVEAKAPRPTEPPRPEPPKIVPVKKAQTEQRASDRKERSTYAPSPSTPKEKDQAASPAAPVAAPASAPVAPPPQQQAAATSPQQQGAAPQARSQVQVEAQSSQVPSNQAPSNQAKSIGGLVGGGGGRILPGSAFAPALAPALAKAGRFAFDYSFEPGLLTIKAAATGTLSVSAADSFSSKDSTPLFTKRVEKDSTTQIPVPAQNILLIVTFSAQDDSAQPATIEMTSVSRSGTVETPNASPNSKIVLRLELR